MSESEKEQASASGSQKTDKPKLEPDEELDPNAEQMEADFDIGTAIRDDLIPNALKYYLGAIEDEDSDGWSDEDGADEEDSQGNPKQEECK